ncbi:Uncharacterised protein [Vibrio cholerae]|nr:Uncharacterised protein [Vibrio cholerae]
MRLHSGKKRRNAVAPVGEPTAHNGLTHRPNLAGYVDPLSVC